MSQQFFSKFMGIKRDVISPDAPQVAFLDLRNFIFNRIKGGLMKRGGSNVWATTGDSLGMGAYIDQGSPYRVPGVVYVIRHRRNGATSFIEYLNWATNTWTAITLGASTSFGVNGIGHFAQIGDLMAICAGRPAKLTDPIAGTVSRLGGPAPTAAPTWGNSGTGLTGTAYGFYTFYDSTTGWESSQSPIVGPLTIANKQIDWSALETTCAREGVDKKRLYRTQMAASGEPPYYRVTEIALATTTYADLIADASLGAQYNPDAVDVFDDHNPPPTDSYLCIEYEGHIFIASGNSLYYSKKFDGNYYQLEYFSDARRFDFPQRITGLAYSPDFGRLLVFTPPGYGIHQISGRSESTFEQGLFKGGEGTNFPESVAVHENRVAYWGRNQMTILTPGGVEVEFAENVKEILRPIIARDYNSNVFIFTLWHPVLKQFLSFVSLTDTSLTLWANVNSGFSVDWGDVSNGSIVRWG
jgi:hypothetical protein